MSTTNSHTTTDIKNAFSRIGKSIAVITLADEEGRQATISSAFTYLTQEPPTLLLALEKSSSLYGKLSSGQSFAVNVLGDGHQAVVDACARQKGEARFSVGDWQIKHGVPILADAQAAFVCELAQLNEFETHGLLVATVKAIETTGDLSPLIYVGGGLQVCA